MRRRNNLCGRYCKCAKCVSKCSPRGLCAGPTGSTGPTGPCCTGPTGSNTFAPALSVYNVQTEGSVVAGANILWTAAAMPVDPAAFSVNAGTGVITILRAGTYEVVYGYNASGTPPRMAAVLNSTNLPATSFSGPSGQTTIATQFVATAGSTLAIKNIGGAGALVLASNSPDINAFLTLKRVA